MESHEVQLCPQLQGNAEQQRVKVATAKNYWEKFPAYRLRYQVYVEEMGRRLPSADHRNRLVFDNLDAWGDILCAQVGAKIIGTVRLNIGPVEKFPPELVRMFHMAKFQEFYDKRKHQPKFSFSSKYVVDAAFRRSQAAFLVIGRSYELYRNSQGIQFSFAGCNPSMVPLYEHMGFQRFAKNVTIPEYGCMVPLVLLLEDESHLRLVGSPLLRDARKRQNDQTAACWFGEEFPETARFVNSRLVNEDELWLILWEKLGQSPLLVMPVLAGLTEKEAKKFLHIGIIHRYQKGENILNPGDFCHEMNILLSGSVMINNPAMNPPLDRHCIKQGDLCGRVALLQCGKQVLGAAASTEAELFIISGLTFAAFCCGHPQIARKVLRNIGAMANMGENRARLGPDNEQ